MFGIEYNFEKIIAILNFFFCKYLNIQGLKKTFNVFLDKNYVKMDFFISILKNVPFNDHLHFILIILKFIFLFVKLNIT